MSAPLEGARRIAMGALRTTAPRFAAEISWRRALAQDRSLAVVRRLVRPGDVVADVGASRGVFTVELQRLVGPQGRVIAFEPNPSSLAHLRRLSRPGTVIHPIALSDRRGTAVLHLPVLGGRLDTGLGSLERPGTKRHWSVEAREVPTGRFDDEFAGDRLDFVKCDVEGHEHEVLIGARQTVGRLKPVVFVEIEQRHRDLPIEATFALLGEWGYEGWALFADGARPLDRFDASRDQRPADDAVDPSDYVHNFVFLPEHRPFPGP